MNKEIRHIQFYIPEKILNSSKTCNYYQEAREIPIAFILINANVASEEELITKLREIPGVVEANIVYGIYDIVVKVQADTHDELRSLTTTKLRHLSNIRSTMTMITVE